MKTFLVPVDFSSTSVHAARYARQLAKQVGAKIILVHAYEPPPSFPMVEGMLYTEESLRELMKDKLNQLAAEMEKEDPLIKTEAMLMDGNLKQVTTSLTEAMQVFLIVMGITGAGKIKETFIGSNTLAVAKANSVPVLIVPEQAQYTLVNDVGLTTDFRDVAENIPDKKIKEFLVNAGARLHVLNVDFDLKSWNNDTPFQSGLIETMFESFHPTYHFIEGENVAEDLSSYALNNSIEMLIAVPKKHNMMQKIFGGSHTKELAFHSKVPVLVIHE
ncbi:MAG: universal stress protein [Chitinophagaceae bacterium]|nr:universal stress protein [Chitinophagaceae bacterium]